MDEKNGGPAFPVMTQHEEMFDGGYRTVQWPEGGMSLRDYFAAAALHAPWGEGVTPAVDLDGIATQDDVAALAANCYALADALLKERSKS